MLSLRRALDLMAKRMDERLACCAIDEGVDHVSVDDFVELVVLLGEALHGPLEGLVGPLLVVAEVPRVLGPRTLEVVDKRRLPQQRMLLGSSCSSQALVELDRSRGSYCTAKSSSDPSALMARR